MTASTSLIQPATVAKPVAPFDLTPFQRRLVGVAGGIFSVACTVAVTRAIADLVPAHPGARDVAVMVHLATVVPAVPLGAWLMLNRKGTPRHKQWGKVWVALMVLTAIASLFIHQLNPGGFSPVHLFVPLTLHASWKTVATARRGDIAGHRKALLGFYLGAMMIPGAFAFLPGRLMGTWLFG